MAEKDKDIAERFGTEFLTRPPGPTMPPSPRTKKGEDEPPSSARGVDSSASNPSVRADFDVKLQAFAARRVLVTIGDLQEKKESPGVRLRQVSEQTGMDAEVLLPVTRMLEELDLLETLQVDDFGDHLVSLTSEAQKLLTPEKHNELLLRLGLG